MKRVTHRKQIQFLSLIVIKFIVVFVVYLNTFYKRSNHHDKRYNQTSIQFRYDSL